MASQQEVVLAALSTLAAVLYFWVAWLQSKRTVAGPARGALLGFVFWWGGLGVISILTLVFTFGAPIESAGLIGARIIVYSLLIVIFAMLAGLAYYLVFLYTGRSRTFWLIAAFYVLMTVMLVWLIEGHSPHIADNTPHINPGDDNQVTFHPHDEPPVWASAMFSLGIVLPPLAAAVAYALLFFRTHDTTARYRIAMVSTGFVLWFGYSALGTLAGIVTGSVEQSFIQQLVGQLMGLLAAALTAMAYHPPRWVERRLALRGLTDPAPPSRPPRP